MKTIYIDGNSLTIEEYYLVATGQAVVSLTEEVKARIKKTADYLQDIFEGNRIIYGMTTGVGAFRDKIIAGEENDVLQEHIVMAHLVGVGEPFPREIVRGVMLLKANSIAKGYHGVRVSILECLISMLNNGVHPVIPQKGSVGATGDLIPGAYIIEVLIGRGKAEYLGEIIEATEALKNIGISPAHLNTREGKALTVGTGVMTAVAALNVYESQKIIKLADVAAALSTESMKCITEAFDSRIQNTRPFKGQIKTAANCRKLMEGSELIYSSNDETYERLDKIVGSVKEPELTIALKQMKSKKSYKEIYDFFVRINQNKIVAQQIKGVFSKLKTDAANIKTIHQARDTIKNAAALCKDVTGTDEAEVIQSLSQYLHSMVEFCEGIEKIQTVVDLKKDCIDENIRKRIHILTNSLFQLPKGPESYAIRCIPQVNGPTKDAWNFVKDYVEIEMNCASDFSHTFPDEDVCITGGNMHGQTIAMAMDFFKIAMAELGSISERRVYKLLDKMLNNTLTSNLLSKKASMSGLNLGMKYIQFTSAALVSENKILCHPAGIDSIPTGVNEGDHVSMGTIAARKATELIENLWYILAIEFVSACQGIDLRFEDADCEMQLGSGTKVAYIEFRKDIAKLEEDGIEIGLVIEKAKKLLKSEQYVRKIEEAIGSLAI